MERTDRLASKGATYRRAARGLGGDSYVLAERKWIDFDRSVIATVKRRANKAERREVRADLRAY